MLRAVAPPRHLALVFAAAAVLACGTAAPPLVVEGAPLLEPAPGETPAPGSIIDCELLIVGGGTGGVAAALAATREGAGVCLTEETDWLGGQFTAQGLNASDEHRYIDTTGSTRSFATFRTLMRDAYGGAANPGACWVSHLCAEPHVALGAIGAMMREAIDAGTLRVFYELKATAAEVENGVVRSVTLTRTDGAGDVRFRAQQTIDATELGDLLPLTGTAYRIGQEARADTGEADAPEEACPACVQSITYVTILEKRPDQERHVISKPEGYGVYPWLRDFDHVGFPMFGQGSVWSYRRIVAGEGRAELSIMNWGYGNDYWFGSTLERPQEEIDVELERARQRTLGYVYWLQTEADGHGYPNLKLRSDLLGTDTGVAKYPYIREGRRVRGLVTVKTEDISDAYVTGRARAHHFADSGGIGLYPLDMHRNVAEGSGYPSGHTLPFQIPIGAIIPETIDGLLAGAKNLGTTHLTNSAYRLHPIEWAVGEAAGALAAMAIGLGVQPRAIYADARSLLTLQDRLAKGGAPLFWTDDVRLSDPDFADIQLVGAASVMNPPDATSLAWQPDGGVNRAQAAAALVQALGLPLTSPVAATFEDVPVGHWAFAAVEALVRAGIVRGDGTRFRPADPLVGAELAVLASRVLGAPSGITAADTGPVARRDLARVCAATIRSR